MKHFGVLSSLTGDAKPTASFDVPIRPAPIRSFGESESRLSFEYFKPLKRIHVAAPRSAKLRKNKKRHQAWTLTKEFKRQAGPSLRYNSILDRKMNPAQFVVFDAFDRLTNGLFGKHFDLYRNPSLDVPTQDLVVTPVKANDNIISDYSRALMDSFKPVTLEGTIKREKS